MSAIVSRLGIVVLVVGTAFPWPTSGSSASDAAVEEVTIYRDDFGIPNIFAETEEGAVFGMGYAQAEDRLEELLKQYRRAEGTMAEAFGPEFVKHDYRQRLWRHRAISEANHDKLPAKVRALIDAYQAGIKQYMKEHPNEVPAWVPDLQPWQITALSRLIIWGWPEGQAGGDLERAGIKPDPVAARGSNQWVVAANRTVDGVPLACIDPHLSWYGEFRFYEARLYGGELQTSGVAIPGLPMTTLGHNRYCSVAMTTGGPDTGDVYEEEIDPSNPRRYRYDGGWRDMTVRTEVIKIKDGDKVREQKFEIESTHHGPIVARKENKAYAMKIPYAEEFRLVEQTYAMVTARNLAEVKKALSLLQLMPQNVMVATVDGDIYYLRNGRVPIRPNGHDWKRPVPGNMPSTEWQGIHPFADLIHCENPWQGYLQNCNVSPEHMTKFCEMVPERYKDRPYLYNTDNPLHQRAATVQELLHANTRLSVADGIAIALSPEVYNADRWQARLVAAWDKADKKQKSDENVANFYKQIVTWNRRTDPDSTGAIAFQYWKNQMWKAPGGDLLLRADRGGMPPPAVVTDENLLTALNGGSAELQKNWGRFDVKYGDVYRVGREGSERTWPVGGGSIQGIATPRAISFQPAKDGKTFIGRGGQTSVQVVQLTNPPKSWTLLPLGESDRKDSKHWDDQAEKLFSPGKMKPTYYQDKEELMKHVESKKVLRRQRT